MIKISLANAGDTCLIPGLGRSPGVRNGNPLQYSFLEIYMGRGGWWAMSLGSQELEMTEHAQTHSLEKVFFN